MSEEEKEKSAKKNQTAEEVAKILVENMKANMADPEFWDKRERRLQEAADKVLEKRKKRREAQKEK